VGNSLVQKLTMQQMREKIGALSLNNQYLVNIPISNTKLKKHFDINYGEGGKDIPSFVTDKLGFLCAEATLPVTSFATGEVKGDFMGVPQEFAHTRLYADMDLTFYVDSDYRMLRFFEGWMDFISGASEVSASTVLDTNAYRRFKYPEEYKIQKMEILKFEKDHKRILSYKFVNAFPKGLVSIPVSYGSAELLKITTTFNYDRYVTKREKIEKNAEREEFEDLTKTSFERNERLVEDGLTLQSRTNIPFTFGQ
jgi:hypothetical protein